MVQVEFGCSACSKLCYVVKKCVVALVVLGCVVLVVLTRFRSSKYVLLGIVFWLFEL